MLWLGSGAVRAADTVPPPARTETTTTTTTVEPAKDRATEAVAAKEIIRTRQEVRTPDFLELLVDSILGLFNIRSSGNTITHYVISALMLVVALLARRIVTRLLFPALKKLAAKTETTLDDKLFPALESPVAAFIMVVGIFAALKVLKLSEESDYYISVGSRGAFALVIFWGFWRAFGALMDHAAEVATRRQMGIAAFMPWLRKTLMVIFAVLGVLVVIQSLGYGENIKAIIAGLGVGSLAVALAAQDTLANVFGAIVVASDQPFRIGEAVKIGQNTGTVEDIGLRSTRIRLVDKSLMTIPNKTVAAETITNFSRFTRRRVEQVFGLTYDATPEQMTAIVDDIKKILTSQPDVDANSVMVFFRDLNASSLDIWVVYELPDPDFKKHMAARQRNNVLIMQAVAARGLSFAFPSQSVYLAGEIAERLAARPSAESAAATKT